MSQPRPIFAVSVSGQDITRRVEGRLVSLTHTDNRGFEADTVELVLDDSDGRLDIPARGAALSFSIGWEGEGLVDKGRFTVDEIEHSGAPDQLSIRGRSADLMNEGLATKRERSWHGKTVGDIVRAIAGEGSVAARVGAGLATLVVDHLDQTSESNLNLLTRLAEQFDAIATVKAGALMFIRAGQATTASGLPLPAVTITRASGDRHRFAIAERDTFTAVRAYYQDTRAGVKGEVIYDGKVAQAAQEAAAAGVRHLPKTYASRANAEKATRAEWKRAQAQGVKLTQVTADYQDNKARKTGTVAFDGKAAKATTTTARAGGKPEASAPTIEAAADSTKTLRHTYASKTNAERAARAAWLRLQRGVATFSITLAKGRPDLFPELPATVRGFKPEIDSTAWLITRVVNSLTDAGYTTAVELEIKQEELGD